MFEWLQIIQLKYSLSLLCSDIAHFSWALKIDIYQYCGFQLTYNLKLCDEKLQNYAWAIKNNP